ncbi:hypothetical protein LXL04_001260 [Taraxacum kok-saghyz]
MLRQFELFGPLSWAVGLGQWFTTSHDNLEDKTVEASTRLMPMTASTDRFRVTTLSPVFKIEAVFTLQSSLFKIEAVFAVVFTLQSSLFTIVSHLRCISHLAASRISSVFTNSHLASAQETQLQASIIMASTGELLATSHSSISISNYRSLSWTQGHHRHSCYKLYPKSSPNSTRIFSLKTTHDLFLYRPITIKHHSRNVITRSVVPEKPPTSLSADFVQPTELQPDNTGGGGSGGEGSDNNWGGSGGGGGGDGGGASDESQEEPKKSGMSMSQKLTLGYATLVGLGGLMGYLKSGSQRSLISGGVSAALLYYVYTQLPVNPVFASCIGLGLSAALLGVMGTRFKKSGKVFPAGVVSVVSLVMTGGYLHGVMRSFH